MIIGKSDYGPTTKLTPVHLKNLKETGYRYVLVKGLTIDRQDDYFSLHYVLLIPIRDLPEDPAKKGIYEPIDSQILMNWAESPDDQVKVLVATMNQ